MYLLGQWATVCGSSWDLLDAVVACRQLGYSTALASARQTEYGGSSDLLWPYEIDCNGYESNLTECAKRRSTCSRYSSIIAGAVCESDAQSIGHIIITIINKVIFLFVQRIIVAARILWYTVCTF